MILFNIAWNYKSKILIIIKDQLRVQYVIYFILKHIPKMLVTKPLLEKVLILGGIMGMNELNDED